MSSRNPILCLMAIVVSFCLFSGCQKNQIEDSIMLSESGPITNLQEVNLNDLKDLGIDINDSFDEAAFNHDFEPNQNAVDFRDHRPILDPCSEGAPIFRMDIENFTLGADINTQSSRFQLINPNSHDGFVMPEYNNQFVFWGTEVLGLGSPKIDAHTLLDLGTRTSGRYMLGFNLKVLPEHTAYFDVHRVVKANIEDNEVAAKFWFFNHNVGIIGVGGRYFTFEYKQNTWMDIHLDFDINNNLMRFYINEDLVSRFPIAPYAGAVGQTVQIQAVTYSTGEHQRNTGVSVAAPTYYGGFKTDNHCFSRVNR